LAKPKLLFVTYGFPPARRAGCIRTWNIAKYLARTGWTVTILTPDPALHRNIDQPEETTQRIGREGLHRLPTGHRWPWLASESIRWPNEGLPWLIGGGARRAARYFGIDPSVGWISPAQRASRSLTTSDVDVILASGPPFSAFRLAKLLAKQFRCPYVLDYRDLWSRHLHNPAPHALHREANVIRGSAAVTVVSPSWRQVLDRQFAVGEKVHVVSNGYDPEELTAVKASEFNHFPIVYTGSFWPPKRTISPVMAALQRLKESEYRPSHHWMFHYYGRHGSHVREEADRFNLMDHVVINGMTSRSIALAAVKAAGAAVVVTSVEENGTLEENGMVTGKIFEAVGLGAPILLVAPLGSDARAVIETTGRGRGFTAHDLSGIASFLTDRFEGKRLESNNPTAYTWAALAGDIDRLLRSTIKI